MFNYSYCSSVAGAEKLQERAKRFGLPDPTEDTEKKKKRAERFGQPEDKEFEAKKKVAHCAAVHDSCAARCGPRQSNRSPSVAGAR